MNFDTCIIVCKRAIKHDCSYDGLLSREVRLKYRIRKCRENTRDPERILLSFVAVEYIRSVEIEVNVDYD